MFGGDNRRGGGGGVCGGKKGRFQIMGPTTTCMYSFHDILTDFRMGTTALLVMLGISRA